MEEKSEKFISFLSLNNWIPLIAMAVSIALTFGATITRIALLEQKLDTIQIQQTEIIALLKDNQNENEQLSLKVNTLETLINIK